MVKLIKDLKLVLECKMKAKTERKEKRLKKKESKRMYNKLRRHQLGFQLQQ